LSDIKNISINSIIAYNARIGNAVYVIDIYRHPIEHKISYFFEHIEYHFNNSSSNIAEYPVDRLIKRFNRIFPFIDTANYFLGKYELSDIPKFNAADKHAVVREKGVCYIALRLSDSPHWGAILSSIIGQQIKCIRDYETKNKPINKLYETFVREYKLPNNFIEMVETDANLMYFCSEQEQSAYINKWKNRLLGDVREPFTPHQYDMYNETTIENACFTQIQYNHYIDDGCKCVACNSKRRSMRASIVAGTYTGASNHHANTTKEFVSNRTKAFCSRATRINASRNSSMPVNKSISRGIMTKIVGKSR